jgi:hypothetical protein
MRVVVPPRKRTAAVKCRCLMSEFAVHDVAEQAIEAQVASETPDPGPLWGIAWRTRSAAWMLRHRAVLQRAL